jgi:Skp family chaperone for outer membrane proteins
LDFCAAPSHIAAVTALLFDTLRLSRTLRDKGHFSAEQAEALAEALGEASQGDLATKADLAELRTEIAKVRTEIAELRTELKTEIAELRTGLKTEILELRTELKTEIAELRNELKAEIADVRNEIAAVRTELLKWIIGAIGFQTVVLLGALISIIKIFAK